MSTQSYAAGNRVYNGGSSQPTVGTVDPEGYVNRSLNMKTAAKLQNRPLQDTKFTAQNFGYKPGGQSDRRSGLAQAALERVRTQNKDPQPASSTPQARPFLPTAQAAQSGLAVSSTGQLSLAPDFSGVLDQLGKETAPNYLADTSLGFDAEASDQVESLAMQRARMLQELVRSAQGLERDYTDQARGLEQTLPRALREVLNDFSGRGMAFSSGYVENVGEVQNSVADQLSRLQDSRTSGLMDLLRQRTNFDEDYSTMIAQIQRAAARRAAERPDEVVLPESPTLPDGSPNPNYQGPNDTVGGGTIEQPIPQAPQPPETADQRINRIVYEIMSGQRDLNSVRASVDRLAGRPVGDYSAPNADTQYLGDPMRLAERIRQIFVNRGVPLERF